MRFAILYIGLVFLLINGCKKDQFETYDRTKDSDYFNDTIGNYTIYSVEEILFDDFTNTSDTSNYQIKEVNASSFTDNLKRHAIKVDRFKRANDSSVWKYLNSWYTVKAADMVERIEENKRLVKLSFPVTIDAVWNANAYNMDNAVTVFYGLINQRYNMDNFRFRYALSVESTNVNNEVSERSFREVYVRGIGLVYKFQVSIEKFDKVYRGFKIKYKYISHGH